MVQTTHDIECHIENSESLLPENCLVQHGYLNVHYPFVLNFLVVSQLESESLVSANR